jgi:hypothetical protein
MPTGEVVDAAAAVGRELASNLGDYDANNNIFTVAAHDNSLLGIVDFFLETANEWKRKGWAEKGRWAFLKNFSRRVVNDAVT